LSLTTAFSGARRPASVIRTVTTSIGRHDALGGGARQPGAHKLDHVGDREAVRQLHLQGS